MLDSILSAQSETRSSKKLKKMDEEKRVCESRIIVRRGTDASV